MMICLDGGSIWGHERVDMGACEGGYGCTRGAIMDLESRAISARVTKQIVTI